MRVVSKLKLQYPRKLMSIGRTGMDISQKPLFVRATALKVC